MKSRVVTALVLGGIVISAVLLLPTWALAIALGVPWLAGAWEWTQFTGNSRIPSAIYALAVLLLMLVSGAFYESGGTLVVAAAAVVWWAVAAGLLWSYPRPLSPLFAVVAGPLTLIPAWYLLSYLHGTGPQGPALTLSLLGIIWAADVGAYLVGRRIGRVKLAPSVSPGKTWEGAVGGMVAATAVAVVAAIFLDVSPLAFVMVALVAALVSIIGDLTVSMFKRNVGLKDSGRLLPGHGGVLDRIDSLSAAIPFFFVGLHLAGLWV